MGNECDIEIAPSAHDFLAEIRDKKVLSEIYKGMEVLSLKPDRQGKALGESLDGYRSIRAWRGLYRVIYRVDPDKLKVTIFAIGKRLSGKDADIYAAAERLIRSLRK
jgi:mRNA-degrading endonuclease RelE of RelBE toxin-antitoxin system